MMLGLQFLAIGLLPFCASAASVAADKVPKYQSLPPLREQATIQDAWTKDRISQVPQMLQKHGVDAWLMSQREHAEDTVFWSLKSFTQFAARRRTVNLFLANATEGTPSSYTWIDNTPKVWTELLDILEAQNPASIVVNVNSDIAFSGGLHVGEMEEIIRKLGDPWKDRLVIEPMIGLELVATMMKDRLPWYKKLQETAWAMISEAFSEAVITPGKTTTEDVEWWLREKVQQMNYSTWFQPDVEIVTPNTTSGTQSIISENIINYGDVLHVDFGVTALGLNTDTQHLAYVLYPGETEADIPASLLEGLKKVNRLQDILVSNMKIGTTGNDILKTSLAQMKSEGFDGSIYCHPIGDWGHSAGTLIGMTNLQDGVPVLGDLPLLDHTYYSVELFAKSYVPEINGTLNFYQEEDIYWVEGDKWDWVYGRQDRFHLVRTPAGDALRLQTDL